MYIHTFHDKFKPIILSILLILGVIFLFLPPRPTTSSSHIKSDKVSVTVISIPTKQNHYPTNKIIGCVLLGIAVLGAIFIPNNDTALSTIKETPADKLSTLTPQEKKIYNLIKSGKTNKEIAAELFVSISTVKTHINNIYKKTGVSSRKEII